MSINVNAIKQGFVNTLATGYRIVGDLVGRTVTFVKSIPAYAQNRAVAISTFVVANAAYLFHASKAMDYFNKKENNPQYTSQKLAFDGANATVIFAVNTLINRLTCANFSLKLIAVTSVITAAGVRALNIKLNEESTETNKKKPVPPVEEEEEEETETETEKDKEKEKPKTDSTKV